MDIYGVFFVLVSQELLPALGAAVPQIFRHTVIYWGFHAMAEMNDFQDFPGQDVLRYP
jgi:hypothetical protein